MFRDLGISDHLLWISFLLVWPDGTNPVSEGRNTAHRDEIPVRQIPHRTELWHSDTMTTHQIHPEARADALADACSNTGAYAASDNVADGGATFVHPHVRPNFRSEK